MIGTITSPATGISPPPAQRHIQQQADEQDRRQVRAEVGLLRIGVHGSASNSGSNPTFRPCEQRHDDHRSGSYDDSRQAPFRRSVADQRGAGFVEDVQRQRNEAPADDSQCR